MIFVLIFDVNLHLAGDRDWERCHRSPCQSPAVPLRGNGEIVGGNERMPEDTT